MANKLAKVTDAAPIAVRKEDREREERWRAEEDLRTMQRAQEILKDRRRMVMMKKCAMEQAKALKSVTQMK